MQTPLRIYLCGPMAALTDTVAGGWRKRARVMLEDVGHIVDDPMDRPTPKGATDYSEVAGDVACVRAADVVLVNFDQLALGSTQRVEGVGTAMEVLLARQAGVAVVAIRDTSHGTPPSPWVSVHADAVVQDLESAIDAVGYWGTLWRARRAT